MDILILGQCGADIWVFLVKQAWDGGVFFVSFAITGIPDLWTASYGVIEVGHLCDRYGGVRAKLRDELLSR